MDLNKIFNTFHVSDEKTELENFRSSNVFKLRMFLKLINEGKAFKSIINTFQGINNSQLKGEELDKAGDVIIYFRSYYWFEQINLDKFRKDDLIGLDLDNIYLCIDKSIKFYEIIEEYEKCAKLKKFKDFISSF
jgi:hypothetical protein